MPINHRILVVGGAGYIGSHMVLSLRQAGYETVVLDNLSKGHRDAVHDAELIQADIADARVLHELFTQREFAAVMHFASFIEVGESVRLPIKYYQNNVAATLNLLESMLAHRIRHFIFSSTAAVYGEPRTDLIDETHALAPINPYGRSKWMVEQMIRDAAHSDGLNYAILRYFNAAGADPEGRAGERHDPESHLIPIVLQVAAGERAQITINGDQHATPDGTCVRDYIHVTDICHAHLLALQALLHGRGNLVCNLGTGRGHSILQVLESARRVTGHPIPSVIGPPREGDPATLVADPALAKKVLDWQPKYPDLDAIIGHAWNFMRKNLP